MRMGCAWSRPAESSLPPAASPLCVCTIAPFVCSKQYESLQPEHVTVLAPEEGVYLFMRAVLAPGDRIICTFPGYQSLYAIAGSMGCKVDLWEPEEAAGTCDLRFEVQTLERMLERAEGEGRPVQLVVINFPHNPTGFLPCPDEWQRLVAACRAHDGGGKCLLFSDEMYRTLEFDPASRLPAACDLYENAVSLSGISKTLGLPGLRIGWLASRALLPQVSSASAAETSAAAAVGERVLLQQRIRELKDYTTICSSAPSELLAIMALRSSAALTAANLELIRSNVARIDALFSELPEVFTWHAPRAGSVAFPRLLKAEPIEAFCERLVRGCGVLLLPASVYGHQGSVDQGRFRIGLGRRNLPDCLERLRGFLLADR
jgi:aspartate/methionine/tyrosine aminotransferase